MTGKILRAMGTGLLMSTALAGSAAAQGHDTEKPAEPRVLVRVQNFAAVPAGTWTEAANHVESIFALAGVKVAWLDCPTETGVTKPGCMHAPKRKEIVLRLIERPGKKVQFDAATGAVAMRAGENTGSGFVTIYYNRSLEIAQRMGVNAAVVLGHALAHEIGHLLLPSGSHSSWGLMRATLGPQEWGRAVKGSLLFDDAEVVQLLARFNGRE